MQLPLFKNANVKGKRVFVRVDLDVPLAQHAIRDTQHVGIEDDTRLKAALPTIEYLLKQNCKVIIAGHLGRPKGVDKLLSLEPVARWFSSKYHVLSIKYGTLGELSGWQIGENVFLLENLRFYEGEEKNDAEFARQLAGLADIYVNDAFAMSHRKHASIVGITHFLPHFAGLRLQEEVETLSAILENPKRPLAVIIGGAKLETKLPLVEKMHHLADYVLVGGKLVEDTKTLLKMQHEKLNPKPGEKKSALLIADLRPDGADITPNSVENFLQIVALAKTVIWNGPLGKISQDQTKLSDSEEGSKRLAEGLVKSSAYTVVGGGDTVGFLEKACLLDSFACLPRTRSFLSTGGGAMLALLSGEKLPGIEALTR